MTATKPPKSKLNEALRVNLRLRKAQQQARETDSSTDKGVRYSGFAVREQRPDDPQAPED
jgi:hypothetical protein